MINSTKENSWSNTEGSDTDLEGNYVSCMSEGSSDNSGCRNDVEMNRVESLNPDENFLEGMEKTASQSQSGQNEGFEVFFEEGSMDPENIMMHISLLRKHYTSSVVTLISAIITMISSCWSLVAEDIMSRFHISREVGVLGISLYIFGLGFGPLLLSPISELYGR